MKNVTRPTQGKILIHDRGAGSITPGDIERRARELASIDGRAVAGVDDRERAARELRGETIQPASDDAVESTKSLSRDPSDPLSDRGLQRPNYEGSDEEKVSERMVAEGVEEAQHDQMLAARRQRGS